MMKDDCEQNASNVMVTEPIFAHDMNTVEPGWISVEDHMPELDVPVLVTDGEHYLVMSRSKFSYSTYTSEGWYLEGVGGYEYEIEDLDEDKITHWMAIPSLPDGGTFIVEASENGSTT